MWMRLLTLWVLLLAGCAAPRVDGAAVEQRPPEAPIRLQAERQQVSPISLFVGNPAARQVVTASLGGQIIVWDTTTGRTVRVLRAGGPRVDAMAVARDGAHVATSDEDGALSVYPMRGGAPIELRGPVEDFAGSCQVAYSPRPDELAVVCGGAVEVWDLSSREVLARHELGRGVSAIGHTAEGALLLHARDGELLEWRGGHDATTIGQIAPGARVEFSPRGDFLAAETDTALELIATADGASVWRRDSGETTFNASGFAPSGELLWFDALGDMGSLDTSTLEVTGPNRLDMLGSSTSSLVVSGAGGEVVVREMYGFQIVTRQAERVGYISDSGAPLVSLQQSADGDLLLWVRGIRVVVFDLSTLDLVAAIEDGSGVAGAALSPGGGVVASWSGGNSYVLVRDVETGSYVDSFRAASYGHGFQGAVFVSERELWTATGREVRAWRLEGQDDPIATYAPDLGGATIDAMYATRAGRPWLRLTDGRVGELGRDGEIARWLDADEASPRVVRHGGLTVTSDDSALRLERGAERALMTSYGEHWAMWTPDGLFAASAEPGRMLHGVQGDRIVDLDQIALARNRPGLVFARLGLGTPELHDALEARWRLRLTRSGFTPEDLDDVTPRPRVHIASAQMSTDAVTLDVEATSPTGLRSLQVSVNGVGMYPGEGTPLTGERTRRDILVPLGHDRNVIEVTAFDTRGREALRARRTYSHGYHPSADRTLYFIGFGVSDYASDAIVDLGWAHQDARDLAATFGKMGEEGSNRLDRVVSRSWIDAEVTPAALAEARALLEESAPDDIVVVFIAGHGMYSAGEDPTYYYLTHHTDLDDLEGTALRFEQLEGLLDGIGSRRKLMLMDTCQSGELDSPAPGERARGVASSPMTTRPPLGSQHRRYIWRDLRRRTGAIVISSSRGDEPSIESDAMRNGAFTEAILEAITDIYAAEDESPETGYGKFLFTIESLRDTLATRVPQLTKDRQHPVVDRDNVHVQIELPKVTPLARD